MHTMHQLRFPNSGDYATYFIDNVVNNTYKLGSLNKETLLKSTTQIFITNLRDRET